MSKPTRADREATLSHEYGADWEQRNTNGQLAQWRDTGVWPKGCFYRFHSTERMAQLLADQRAELLRLAAAVAMKVGEHEYARGYDAGVEDEARLAPSRGPTPWDGDPVLNPWGRR